MISYDKNGNCTRCRLPGSGFVSDGVCECADEWTENDATINERLAPSGYSRDTGTVWAGQDWR